MKRDKSEMEDELRSEYDLKKLRVRKLGSKRRSFARKTACSEPDVIEKKTTMNDLEILELFNERAKKIQRLERFVEALKSERKVEIKLSADGTEVTEVGLDEESLSAALLTLRMFIQNNEDISFYKMSNLYSRLEISDDLKARFNDLRTDLNNYLDQYSQLAISDNGMALGKLPTVTSEAISGRLTNRELMDIYIYGDYAHSKQEKREVFKKISTNPLFAPAANFVFINIVETLVSFIEQVAELNRQSIKSLKET